jgi:hypothetical protein
MSSPTYLDLTIAPETRARLLAFLTSITGYEPTLCLMKTTDARWTHGAYGPENVKQVEADLNKMGRPLLYLVDGLIVAIPQFQFLEELSGKMLALRENELLVIDRVPGI